MFYVAETARSWHVGFSDTNYGTLVLISINDRKIRTETSNNKGKRKMASR